MFYMAYVLAFLLSQFLCHCFLSSCSRKREIRIPFIHNRLVYFIVPKTLINQVFAILPLQMGKHPNGWRPQVWKQEFDQAIGRCKVSPVNRIPLFCPRNHRYWNSSMISSYYANMWESTKCNHHKVGKWLAFFGEIERR